MLSRGSKSKLSPYTLPIFNEKCSYMYTKNKSGYIQWLKKVRTQLLHSYVVTLFSINHKMRTSACRALILFFQNHRMSEVFIVVCYAIVACLDPAHSKLIDATFLRKSVKSLRKTLNSAKTRHLSAYCAQDLDMLQ